MNFKEAFELMEQGKEVVANNGDLYRIKDGKIQFLGEITGNWRIDDYTSLLEMMENTYEIYEEPIDWLKVEVDTKIYVKDYASEEWEPRHFAKYEDGSVYAWASGQTSFSSEDNYMTPWAQAKLAE